jgi:hypothetical protein
VSETVTNGARFCFHLPSQFLKVLVIRFLLTLLFCKVSVYDCLTRLAKFATVTNAIIWDWELCFLRDWGVVYCSHFSLLLCRAPFGSAILSVLSTEKQPLKGKSVKRHKTF